ncbi:hypothetical protein OQA88_2634 [Cercophora sp. LCS_1]
MRYQALAFLAAVGSVVAQGVTDKISPPKAPQSGCEGTIDGKFEHKRGETCSGEGILVSQLQDTVITDAQGRTGYIASNYQFQFDGPPQAGAIYTAGFYHCPNGSLALGDSSVFYRCKSGDFYNLYDRWWAEQCSPVEILVMPCGEGTGAAPQNVVGTQVVVTTAVVPIADGQPQVITTTKAIPMCQIGDGQVQGHTTPCAVAPTITPGSAAPEASDGQIIQQPPVSQGTDGQIQVTPAPKPAPSAAVPPAPGVNGTTLARTTVPAPSVLPTGAPPTSAAVGRFQLGSAVALVVGVFVAIWTA